MCGVIVIDLDASDRTCAPIQRLITVCAFFSNAVSCAISLLLAHHIPTHLALVVSQCIPPAHLQPGNAARIVAEKKEVGFPTREHSDHFPVLPPNTPQASPTQEKPAWILQRVSTTQNPGAFLKKEEFGGRGCSLRQRVV
eukprot:1988531-Rhodomonas_salina.1